MDVIAAVSTPVGAGGIGIVRISGKEALALASAVFKSAKAVERFEPSKMYFGEICARDFSDKGYMVYFRAPHSFTGEDVVEFHLHGSPRILSGVVETLIALGARHADRGEYTRRAVLNGKLSLTEAEGVVDMINAESASAVRAAYSMMSGALGTELKSIAADLVELVANMEVVLDYPEETEDDVLPDALARIGEIKRKTQALLCSARTGITARDGLDVAIVGRPNVGKSSLLNCLLKRERAIVSEIAGTTRDLVTESVEYKGVKLNLTDSAGLRESSDKIEQIGVEYAKNAVKSADCVVWVEDNAENFSLTPSFETENKRVFLVRNKADVGVAQEEKTALPDVFFISAKTGEGTACLLDSIVDEVLCGEREAGKYIVSNLRHVSVLQQVVAALDSAEKNFADYSTDCVLIDLSAARTAIGELTGDTATEDVLDSIFARFCVGK